MPTYEQVPIRLQLKLLSNPPVPPLDLLTGMAPRIWRGQAASFQLGCFDGFDAPVDLSNVAYIMIAFQADPEATVPLIARAVSRADPSWSDLVSALGWVAGTEQNGIIAFSAVDMNVFPFSSNGLAEYWMTVQAITTAGNALVYGAGAFNVYNAPLSLNPGTVLMPGLLPLNTVTVLALLGYAGGQNYLDGIPTTNQPVNCIVEYVDPTSGQLQGWRLEASTHPTVAGAYQRPLDYSDTNQKVWRNLY